MSKAEIRSTRGTVIGSTNPTNGMVTHRDGGPVLYTDYPGTTAAVEALASAAQSALTVVNVSGDPIAIQTALQATVRAAHDALSLLAASAAPGFEESLQDFVQVALSRGPNDELAISILRESADLLNRRQPRGGALSEDQVRFLIDSGDFTEEEFAETEASVARGELGEEERKTRLQAVTAALSSAEVATLLNIDTSRVRHRQAKGGLYAFLAGTKRRYPTWQFTGDTAQPVLPGLARLIKAFPEDMQPATIHGFMSTPQEDLLINGERVTPAEWLQQGGAPHAVVDILDGLLQS